MLMMKEIKIGLRLKINVRQIATKRGHCYSFRKPIWENINSEIDSLP